MVATIPFDAATLLDTDEAVAVYLEDAFASGDPDFMTHALGTVVRARGLEVVASKAGVSAERLVELLSGDGHPDFATAYRVIRAVGLDMLVRPERPAAE